MASGLPARPRVVGKITSSALSCEGVAERIAVLQTTLGARGPWGNGDLGIVIFG